MNISLTRLFVIIIGVVLAIVGLGLIIQSPANWFTDLLGVIGILIGVAIIYGKVPTVTV
jgi:xanthosine utilization system XapX-like protein